MEETNWENIKDYILTTLGVVKQNLDEDSIDGVKHYVDHDEFEMSFEGLFIEIMKLDFVPEIDLLRAKEIGLLLKLNEESVFDSEFWDRFQNYFEVNKKGNGSPDGARVSE